MLTRRGAVMCIILLRSSSCVRRDITGSSIRSVLVSGQGVCNLTKIMGCVSLQLIFITWSASIILLIYAEPLLDLNAVPLLI